MKTKMFLTIIYSMLLNFSCYHRNGNSSIETNSRGYVLKADEGEQLPHLNAIVKSSPETGAQNLLTVVSKIVPGTGTGLHYHQHADEIFYVIEGRGTAVVDDVTYAIEEGDLIFIPKNIDHKIRKNDSTGFLKVMFFMDNPELLKAFREEHKQFYITKNPNTLEALNKISTKYGTYYMTMN